MATVIEEIIVLAIAIPVGFVIAVGFSWFWWRFVEGPAWRKRNGQD